MNPLTSSNLPDHASISSSSDASSPDTIVIPRLEESLQVSTQRIETGRVILTKTVEARDEIVSIPLRSEQYTVERTKLDQFVDDMPSPRQEGDTTIYPVVEEVLIVQKRLRLVEEIRVTKQQVSSTHQETVVLRREDVTVKRTASPVSPERTDLRADSTPPGIGLEPDQPATASL